MSDIKLFRIDSSGVDQLKAETVALEKSLQKLIEKHLEALLGVRFLASEYSTGRKHGGRIDTLGIDENGCPVIIEYKRNLNENVINQGLYYLDWLMDHRAEFKLLVMEKLTASVASDIDWSSPRLLCIAGSFTKYDQHSVEQINRNIELIRYARYGDELLMFDLLNRTLADDSAGRTAGSADNDSSDSVGSAGPVKTARVADLLARQNTRMDDLWTAMSEFLLGLGDGDEVTAKQTKLYVAFRRLKNFVCARPAKKHITLWVKVDPATVHLEDGFARDVTNVGHYGTGNLEVTLRSRQDLERAKPLLVQAFEDN
jgi:predicted transport protein